MELKKHPVQVYYETLAQYPDIEEFLLGQKGLTPIMMFPGILKDRKGAPLQGLPPGCFKYDSSEFTVIYNSPYRFLKFPLETVGVMSICRDYPFLTDRDNAIIIKAIDFTFPKSYTLNKIILHTWNLFASVFSLSMTYARLHDYFKNVRFNEESFIKTYVEDILKLPYGSIDEENFERRTLLTHENNVALQFLKETLLRLTGKELLPHTLNGEFREPFLTWVMHVGISSLTANKEELERGRQEITNWERDLREGNRKSNPYTAIKENILSLTTRREGPRGEEIVDAINNAVSILSFSQNPPFIFRLVRLKTLTEKPEKDFYSIEDGNIVFAEKRRDEEWEKNGEFP